MSPTGVMSVIILLWAVTVAMTSAVPLPSYGRRSYADLQGEYAQAAGYAYGRQLSELQSLYGEEYGRSRQYAELQAGPNGAPADYYGQHVDQQEYGAKANEYEVHRDVNIEQISPLMCCRFRLACCPHYWNS